MIAAQPSSPKTVMLVLGSANLQTLRHRVNAAARLYESQIAFDRIIVSGGCGAHGSSICEASRMDSLLVEKGISRKKIFKEEKSKTTKQNYCYSRQLSRQGELLIRPEDHLYVVSSHWHAIPVAACFRRAAGIKNATYHIEGTRKPRGPVDYTHIFKDCKNKNYCKAILWPSVDAAYFNRSTNKIYYFVDDIYYRKTPGRGIDPGYPKKINQYPGWPENWGQYVDAAYYNPANHRVILFKGTQLISLTSDGTLVKGYPKKIDQYFNHWPESWGAGYLGAAYVKDNGDERYLFKQSAYVRFVNGKLGSGFPADITNGYPVNWPFKWGSGGVDAAFYNAKSASTLLYRGTDYLQFSSSDHLVAPKYPAHTSLPWPEDIWGARPETN